MMSDDQKFHRSSIYANVLIIIMGIACFIKVEGFEDYLLTLFLGASLIMAITAVGYHYHCLWED